MNEGYAIKLVGNNLTEGVKFYLLDIEAAGPNIKKPFSRTLVYVTTTVSSIEEEEVVNQDILFFDNKMDAEDLVTMIEKYQAYDEKLCGPIKEDCKLTFEIVKVKSCQKYSDLTKDFLDKKNHMDFNLEQDKAKKWLDESCNLSI